MAEPAYDINHYFAERVDDLTHVWDPRVEELHPELGEVLEEIPEEFLPEGLASIAHEEGIIASTELSLMVTNSAARHAVDERRLNHHRHGESVRPKHVRGPKPRGGGLDLVVINKGLALTSEERAEADSILRAHNARSQSEE